MLGISVYGDHTSGAKLIGALAALEEMKLIPDCMLSGGWAAFVCALYALGSPLSAIKTTYQKVWRTRSLRAVRANFVRTVGAISTPARDLLPLSICYRHPADSRLFLYNEQIKLSTARICTNSEIPIEQAVVYAVSDEAKRQQIAEHSWILYHMGANKILRLTLETDQSEEKDFNALVHDGYLISKSKETEIIRQIYLGQREKGSFESFV